MYKIRLILLVIISIIVTSCDNREDVEGQWETEPIVLNQQDGGQATIVMVMTFTQDGKVTLDADIDYIEPVATPDEQQEDATITVHAKASIDGRWQYVKGKNDEVQIKYDDNSLTITVEEDDIEINGTYTRLHMDNEMRQIAAANYTALLLTELNNYFTTLEHIQGIDARAYNKTVMTFKTDEDTESETDYTCTRI